MYCLNRSQKENYFLIIYNGMKLIYWPVISYNLKKYLKKKSNITTCVDAIDSYRCLILQDSYTKNVRIRGFPGGGKTWCMIYCILYSISKGLKVTSRAIMWKYSLQLGEIHVHQIFNITTKDKLTPHRRAELSVLNLMKKPQ